MSSRDWATQATWFIDPVNGLDTNVGDTLPTAIKTYAELNRRLGGLVIDIAMTITQTADDVAAGSRCLLGYPNPITLTLNGTLFFVGTPTALALSGTGGTITARTNITHASNTPNNITDGGLATNDAWTLLGLLGNRIRITKVGATHNAIAWSVKDLGAKNTRTSAWVITDQAFPFTFQYAPSSIAVNDTYVVETLPDMGYFGLNIICPDADTLPRIVFKDLKMSNNSVAQGFPTPGAGVNCVNGSATSMVMFIGCDCTGMYNFPTAGTMFVGCKIDDLAINVANGFGPIFSSCYVAAVGSVFHPAQGTSFVLDGDTIIQGGVGLQIWGNLIIGTCGIFDCSTDALLIVAGIGNLAVAEYGLSISGTPALYGSGSTGVGLNIEAGVTAVYTAKPTLTGASDTQIGGTGKAYAAIPFVNTTNQAALVLAA